MRIVFFQKELFLFNDKYFTSNTNTCGLKVSKWRKSTRYKRQIKAKKYNL